MHTAPRNRLVASDGGFGEAATSSGAVHEGTCAFVGISAKAS
jgi:hypothetical protein